MSTNRDVLSIAIGGGYDTVLTWNAEEQLQIQAALSGSDVNVTIRAFRKYASSNAVYCNTTVAITQHRSTYQTVR